MDSVYNLSHYVDPYELQNETLEQILNRLRGPKHLPLEIVLPITIIYVLIFLTGVIGNVSVCVVIWRNSNMHTTTNYYLFNLAFSDLTLLILGLPNDLMVYWQQYPWQFGENMCKLRALASEMASYISILTILAFSAERYLAICQPLLSYAMSGLPRVFRILVVLWTMAALCASPFAWYTTVNYIDYPLGSGRLVYESAFCAMLDSSMPANIPMYELSCLCFFFLPMLAIIFFYVRIGLKIRNRSRHSLGKRVEGTVHGEKKNLQSRKSIIRMLCAVVITFFVCWLPFHVQRLMYVYLRDWEYYSEVNEWMYYITGGLYYVSSTINPILYNVMSVKYRNAFKQTLFCGVRSNSTRSKDRFSRDIQSSFRDTIVEVGNDSPQWSKKSVKKPHTNTDVVVMIKPVANNCTGTNGREHSPLL